jgi:hypothetical protein
MTRTPTPERPRVATDVADALAPTLARGLTWLFETVQPPDTIPPNSHHGPTLAVPEVGRSLGFCPAGFKGWPVVVIESTEYDQRPGDLPPLHGLVPGELEAVSAVLAGTFGRAVRGTWNGHPATTGSISLADHAHESLRAAVAYYRAGCPAHRGTVFCSRRPFSESDPACSWNDDGRARAVWP